MDPRASAAIERLTGVAREACERCLAAPTGEEATRAAIEALYAVDWLEEGEIPLPEELTAEQRDLATALAFRGDLGLLPEGAGINRFMIPLTARNRRQWLGLAPGVLEAEEAFERAGQTVREPRWRHYRWLHPWGQAPRGSIKEALATLEPAKRFEAYVELGLGAYMLYTQDPELQSLAEAHGAALGAWAATVAHEIVGHEGPVRDDVKAALFHAVVAAGLPVDEAVERCFVLDASRPERNVAFVRALPPARREALLRARVADGHGPSAIDAACAVLHEFPFASVAQVAGDRFADAVEAARGVKSGMQHPALRKQVEDRQERLRRLAAARPALTDALRRGTDVVLASKGAARA